MSNYKKLNKALTSCINVIKRSPSLFSVNPEKDFTRVRKFSIDQVIRTVICLEAGSMKDELLKQFDYSLNTPTVSAVIQARNKVKVDALLGTGNSNH